MHSYFSQLKPGYGGVYYCVIQRLNQCKSSACTEWVLLNQTFSLCKFCLWSCWCTVTGHTSMHDCVDSVSNLGNWYSHNVVYKKCYHYC